jgi:uncharacterized membrane protein (UPF0136 family)
VTTTVLAAACIAIATIGALVLIAMKALNRCQPKDIPAVLSALASLGTVLFVRSSRTPTSGIRGPGGQSAPTVGEEQ